ncbi:signal recognition particle-docking protein FtsY [Candidatus Poribacteria bacterium]|nr:signal recognition particle-docking protein FtsY [Candidatus Poribacteria bacterium]
MLKNLFRRQKQKDSQPGTSTLDRQPSEKVSPSPSETSDFASTAEHSNKKKSWFQRLTTGLSKTRKNLVTQIQGLLRIGRQIDEELLEEIEEVLIQADVGVKATMTLMDNVRNVVEERMIDESADLEAVIKEQIELILGQDGQSVSVVRDSPHVILVLGVNGAGKTTTIGKLCHRFKSEGKSVLVAAADTFRAAAAEQLQIWCERSDTDLIRSDEGTDPASVVFDALHATQSRQVDVLIIDTAGRLHTKKPLMDELAKIGRVISREIPKAPHEVLLVVDGTAGQNAIIQANVFNEAVPVTGVAVTKLDGTAKGGVVIAIRQEIGVPIKLIGIGEQLDDLRDFVAQDFVSALFENDESSI